MRRGGAKLTVAHQFTSRSLGHNEVLWPVGQVLQVEWDSILGGSKVKQNNICLHCTVTKRLKTKGREGDVELPVDRQTE